MAIKLLRTPLSLFPHGIAEFSLTEALMMNVFMSEVKNEKG